VPLRVPVGEFVPSRSQRRVLRVNRDVELEIGQPMMDGERLDLHHRFHLRKHLSQDWPEPRTNPVDYLTSFVLNSVPTHEFRYRIDGRLAAIAYVDESPACLSSQYAFYDPDLAARSLGTFDVLKEIETARRWRKSFLHLGYYVRGCRSMVYKASFRPHEILVNGEWRAASLEFR
jgi:arginine-tRNA-protein transferase